MLRCRVHVRRENDLGAQLLRARNGRVEIVDLEPEEDAVPARRLVLVLEIRMVLFVSRVELKDERLAIHQAIIDMVVIALITHAGSLETEELGVEARALSHVVDGNQRLGSFHRRSSFAAHRASYYGRIPPPASRTSPWVPRRVQMRPTS